MSNTELIQNTGTEKSGEIIKSKRYKKAIAIGACLAVSATLFASCAKTEGVKEPTEKSVPLTTLTETNENITNLSNRNISPDTIKKLEILDAMSLEEYNQQPRNDRLLFVHEAMVDFVERGLADTSSAKKLNIDISHPLKEGFEPEEFNRPETIVSQMNFLEQLIISEPLDVERANKIMSGLFYYNKPSQPGASARDNIAKLIDEIKNNTDNSSVNTIECALVASSDDMWSTWTDEDGNELASKDIVIFTQENLKDRYDVKFVLSKYIDAEGKKVALWQIVEARPL